MDHANEWTQQKQQMYQHLMDVSIEQVAAGASDNDVLRYLSEEGYSLLSTDTALTANRILRSAKNFVESQRVIDDWRRKVADGATVDDVMRFLIDQKYSTLSSNYLLMGVFDLNLIDARTLYELHPLVEHYWAIERCKRLLAAGANDETLRAEFPYKDWSTDRIDKIIRVCKAEIDNNR